MAVTVKWLCLVVTVITSHHLAHANEFDSDDYVDPEEENEFVPEKRALGNDLFGVAKTVNRGLNLGAGVKGRPSGIGTSQLYTGGCKDRPEAPTNSKIQCTVFSGCRATCLNSYRFPNGETKLYIKCKQGKWEVENSEWETIPHCEPICLPPCQHNGICVRPSECDCPDNYAGPQCQYEKKPCLNLPPMPENAQRACSGKTCTVMCANGYTFPDGTSVTNMLCRNGDWIPTKSEWKSIPNCQPTCTPPCQNGGNCLSYNVCQCPRDFRGPQCQYSVTDCTARKLAFNGGVSCSGDTKSFTCKVTCPSGSKFSTPPAKEYVCLYSTGTFEPSPVPQCVFGTPENELPNFNDITTFSQINGTIKGGINFGVQGSIPFIPKLSGPDTFTVVDRLPHPGLCYAWGGSHYKTFDGRVYSFASKCKYTLAVDLEDNTFSINLEPKEDHTDIKIFAQDKEYVLTITNDNLPVLQVGTRRVGIPVQMSGIVVDNEAHFTVLKLTSIGLSVKWDTKNFVAVGLTEALWNRTGGLCGSLDGRVENDFRSKDGSLRYPLAPFVNSWKVKELGVDQCVPVPVETHACSTAKLHTDEEPHFQLESSAKTFCDKLITDPRFQACKTVIDVTPYYEACKWDFCSCPLSGAKRSQCACDSIAVFVKACNLHGRKTAIRTWRDDVTCPMTCTGGRTYQSCAPNVQETCRSVSTAAKVISSNVCEEGCYCPAGTVLHDQKCVEREQCPCQLRGRWFQPGQKVPKECNTCTCVSGQWSCTQVNCGARCGAVGDPHYQTFDGKRFNFMGKCSYYLMKGDNYSIEAENVACAGAISEAMSFPPQISSEFPSCTKAITIRLGGNTIRLKQGREVLVNEKEVSQLPFTAAGAYIHTISSIFVMVELPNGLELWWDGVTRVYIDAPAKFHDKTKGLCGTFNLNQNDDFLTPENDVEQDVVAFANKWKTKEVCSNVQVKEVTTHPCDVNPHNRATAEKHCAKIKGTLFDDCNWDVDPEPYYQDCLYDLCSCQFKIGQCLCPIYAAYAKECADRDIVINWRNDVRECGVHCPGSQTYQVCGNSCTRSCNDISHNPNCKRQCVEGCNCPADQTINPSTGECIPIGQCPCQLKGTEYPAGYKDIRAGNKGQELCTCRGALWDCRPATGEETKEFPKSGGQKTLCSALGNEEFTNCEAAEPLTCKNMHNPPEFSPAICKPGCKCKKGYVLDSNTMKCILPHECPCHHGGRSYGEGESMAEDCNTCKCTQGKWNCTGQICPGICTAWGDSHYKTFDGRIYDFQGNCDYVLAKGSISKEEVFDISLQNVPCGSGGVTCSKSVTLRVGLGDKQETITFTRDRPVPSHTSLNRTIIREAGLFVFAEVYDLELVLQWDRGTRVYVRVAPKWKNRLNGLCGNYNDNQLDDFQTPSGGLSEVSAKLFGDSWRLQPYCPDSIEIADTCVDHPNRKLWAMKECGVLKSSVFQSCHSEVPLDPYLERCIFDSCACDLGGDCECMCTAIAAYAQECNIRGVPIKWRSQQLCPIQCDEKCSHYSACIQTCPKETCDNYMVNSKFNQLCSEDACVEGCEVKPCPRGQVYQNLTSPECIPIKDCKAKCLDEEGKIYYEGDITEQDECHTCTCSHQRIICLGVPCTTVTTTKTVTPEITTTSSIYTTTETITSTTALPRTEEYECVSGWSKWINTNRMEKRSTDSEPLPSNITMLHAGCNSNDLASCNLGKIVPVCNVTEMADIRCRVAGTHEHYKALNENVECSIMNGGLKCEGSCHDYEISILCKCHMKCDDSHQYFRNVYDCNKYYHCEDTPLGKEAVEKSCPPLMMYNPVKHVCDHSNNVVPLVPECKEACDPNYPNTPDLQNCHIFYQCQDIHNGTVLVEKDCGSHRMYNHKQQVCDWPENVISIRPECAVTTEIPEETTTVEITTTGTTKGGECKHGWSRWFDTPRIRIGDYEKLDELEKDKQLPCSRSEITDIECKFFKDVTRLENGRNFTSSKLLDYTQSGEKVVCKTNVGLLCNSGQQRDRQCEDYRIRIFCNCEGEIIPSTTYTPEETTTIEVTTGVEGCRHGWTRWFDTPRIRIGDYEKLDELEKYKQLPCGRHQITDIECKFLKNVSRFEGGRNVTSIELLDYTRSGEKVVCKTNVGLLCNSGQQRDRQCEDYRIRVFCNCEEFTIPSIETTTQRLTPPIETPTTHLFTPSTTRKEFTTPPGQVCEHGWSRWYNTPKIRYGDYESLDSLEARRELPCLREEITDIECKFYKNVTRYVNGRYEASLELVDYTESGDRLVCKTKKGLECNDGQQRDGRCEDYQIRVFCNCEGPTTTPFFTTTSEKRTTLYRSLPPFTTTGIPVSSTTEVTTRICPLGEYWDCIIPCSQLCSNFEYVLKRDGFCQFPDDCITGCVNEDTLRCGPESLWRDQLTCVESPHCMCVTPSGKLVKPGIPVNETDCEVCQCINNQIDCDKSNCEITTETTTKQTTPKIYTETPPISSTTPEVYTGTPPVRSTTPPLSSTTHPIYTETVPKNRGIGIGGQFTVPVSVTSPVSTTPMIEIMFSTMNNTENPHFENPSSTPEYNETTYETTVNTETEETPTSVTLTENPPVTPPPYCPPERFMYLIDEISEVRFKPSSRQRNTPRGIWKPLNIKNQYLQVDLGQQEPIYGSVVWGYPQRNEYVTSYKVMYSNDGKVFYYVKDKDGKDHIFRGPADSHSKVEQLFDTPVEAQYIRWIPLKWEKFIAMKVELIGCKEISEYTTTTTTPFFISTTQQKICEEAAMGLENGIMADQQITASSVFNNDIQKYGPSHARVNNSGSWVPEPTTLGVQQWIQFDFLEPRILLGIITQGDVDLDSWVIKYTVKYSHDGSVWNPVLETGENTKKVFLANFDSNSTFTNMFERMIKARYLRLIPTMWHKKIALRVEVLGCYLPYPTVTYPVTEETTTPIITTQCTPCKGWQNDGSFNEENCQCPSGKFWDGNRCVHPRDCPCYEGYTSYIAGSHFDTKDCERCICKIGGEKICEKKKCPPCEENLKWVLTPRCGCVCKPCQDGTILCPTSNICINETSWCDGVEDCPNDEINCTTILPPTTPEIKTTFTTIISTHSTKVLTTATPPGTTTTKIPTTTTKIPTPPTTPSTCPEMKCLSGFTVSQTCPDLPVPPAKEPLTFKGRFTGIPSDRLTTKGGIKRPIRKPQKTTPANCPQFCCVPEINCKPECPSGFDIQYSGKFDADGCREFKCVGTATCNITGHSFNTFDGTDFQYEICNHILARDLGNYLWDISIYKTCPDVCSYHITINHNEQEIVLHPDLSVTFNGQKYKNTALLKRIGFQLRKAFTISNIGGYVLFKSRQHGFQLIWDRKKTIEITVLDRYAEQVDGLCGFFNHRIDDDKIKPDGSPARTTKEFGDSWKNPYLDIECIPQPCSVDELTRAEKLCSRVKESLFTQCKNTVDLQRFLSQCNEAACTCLQNKNSTEASCQCDTLLDFVKKCSAADPSVDLSSWRIKYNCPAVCPPPLVYHDCYQRQCEPSCTDMKSGNDCPILRGNCFSGCFCPEGLVRNGDNCVNPEECRDCTCDGFGDPQYMTFDYTNYTFNGNCTYVASRDKNPNGNHTYEILVTNVQCQDEPISTCTKVVHIKYGGHTIVLKRKEVTKQVKQPQQSKELVALLDGVLIQKYPLINNWVHIEHTPGIQVSVLIPKIQLEVSYFYHNFAFTVRLPSYMLGHKAEGLCGNCDGDPTNDLRVKNGGITNDTSDFGLSWLHPLTGEDNCIEIPDNPCVDLSPDKDPCYIILDKERFGKCFPLEDPYPYLHSCQYDRCHSVDKQLSSCRDIEAYARACMDAGLCLDWRSNTSCEITCPPGQVYQECGPGCPITCDNYKTINQNPSSCSLSKVTGCFCPDGQVLLDGKCKPVEHCQPCDKEGHVQGQIWNPDKCTTCMCAKDGNSRCLKTQCPNKPICELGSQLIIKRGTENDCCPQYLCTPPPNCTEANKPVCGKDQIMQIIRDKNNCTRYICDCKPCEKQQDEPPLGPGFVRKVDTSGCCPRVITECRLETCPKPTPCPQFYNLTVIPPQQDQCCPTKFECRPPDDKCIHTIKFTSGSTGGEIPLKQEEQLTVLKNVGNSWTDGPCRSCVCEKKPMGAATAICTTQTCVNQISDEEKQNYDLKIVSVFNQCCPTYERRACKQGNQIYEVGRSWPSPDGNPCKFYKCVSDGGIIQKQENVHTCNVKCQLGFRYEKPADKDKCCGQCRQFACVDVDKLKHVNTNWTSPDFCTNYICREKNGSFVIDSETEKCPAVPPEIENDFTVEFVEQPGKCCKKIVQVACRVGFRTFKVNESWPSPDGNPCLTYKCEQSEGGQLKKTTYFEKCNLKCEKGEEYVPPPPGSSSCCGQCIQRVCVLNNKTYEPGEWYSSDNCTRYECKRDTLTIDTFISVCPDVSGCKPEDIVEEECCKICKPTVLQSGCAPEEVAANKTVKLINVGGCTNLKAIRGFTECRGICNSFTVFNPDTQIHESDCKCCQPIKSKEIKVNLTCRDGTESSTMVSVPDKCQCEVCSQHEKITPDDELFLKEADQ